MLRLVSVAAVITLAVQIHPHNFRGPPDLIDRFLTVAVVIVIGVLQLPVNMPQFVSLIIPKPHRGRLRWRRRLVVVMPEMNRDLPQNSTRRRRGGVLGQQRQARDRGESGNTGSY